MSTKEFNTTVLHLAAYLQMRGFELLRMDPEGDRVRFVFDGEFDSLRREFRKYEEGKVDVNLRDYLSAVQMLKSRLRLAQG